MADQINNADGSIGGDRAHAPTQPPTNNGGGRNPAPNIPPGIQPPAGYNPSNIPAHIQEQLRRQMQQARMMGGHQPLPMGQMPYAGPMAPMSQVLRMAQQQQQHSQQQNQMQRPQRKNNLIPPQRLAALSQALPYHPSLDEHAFMTSLSQFLACVGLPLKKAPVIGGRPVSLLQLFNTVIGLGGFAKVSEGRRWPAVSVSLGLGHSSMDMLASLHSTYGTLLFAYEQFMIHRVPAENIQWSPAVYKLYEAAAMNMANLPGNLMGNSSVPAAPQVPQRLTSVLSRAPSAQDVSSGTASVPPAKKQSVSVVPGGGPQSALDAVTLAQWKNIRANLDSFTLLQKGRCSYRELALLLESGITSLRQYSLNQIQILLVDVALPSPDPTTAAHLVRLLYELIKAPDGMAVESIWKMTRNHGFRHLDLALDKDGDVRLAEMVTNIMRGLMARSDVKASFETASGPEQVGKLFQLAIHGTTLEMRKNALLILAELSPATMGKCLEMVPSFIAESSRALSDLEPHFLTSLARLHTCWEMACPPDPDAAKKIIVSLIQTCSSLFKTIPALVHVYLEISYKLVVQVSSRTAEESDGVDAEIIRAFSEMIPVLLRWAALALLPMKKLFSLIHGLLGNGEFRKSAEATKWFQRVLHSTSFGLPDAGYLELILLIISQICTLCSSKLSGECVGQLVKLLMAGVEGLRVLWMSGDPEGAPVKFERTVTLNVAPVLNSSTRGSGAKTNSIILTDKSPLTWTAGSGAGSSQPYQLYVLMVRILERVSGEGRHGECFVPYRAAVLGWMCGEGVEGALGRQVLQSPELMERYTAILLNTP